MADRPKPQLLGSRVTVGEPGIAPWQGEVIAVKWVRTRSAWSIEVRNDEGIVWSVSEAVVSRSGEQGNSVALHPDTLF